MTSANMRQLSTGSGSNFGANSLIVFLNLGCKGRWVALEDVLRGRQTLILMRRIVVTIVTLALGCAEPPSGKTFAIQLRFSE